MVKKMNSFHDVYFVFDVEPVPVSLLKLQMNSNSIIPLDCREVRLNSEMKMDKIKFLLSIHFKNNKFKNHLHVLTSIIDHFYDWFHHDYNKRNIQCYHLMNEIFFGKKNICDAMNEFFFTEEINFYLSYFV